MIYLNSKELEGLHIGDAEIQRVLLGENLIWENKRIVLLGTNQLFNIADIYSKYAELTADNFFYLSYGSVSGGDSIYNVGEETGYLSVYGWMKKEYDATTGILHTASFMNNTNSYSGAQNVTVVMVTDVSKLEHIGSGQQFNIKNLYPNEYMNFTADNFLLKINHMRSYYWHHFRGAGSWSVDCSIALDKSYNQETGILTCRNHEVAYSGVPSDDWNHYTNTDVYLTRKTL